MGIIDAAIAKLSREQRSEWEEVMLIAKDPMDSRSSWTPEHRLAIRMALADHACSQVDAMVVMSGITQWSRRLGVLLSCVVAREALRFVPDPNASTISAIETAERWVHGKAKTEECATVSWVSHFAEHKMVDAVRAASFAASAAHSGHPDSD